VEKAAFFGVCVVEGRDLEQSTMVTIFCQFNAHEGRKGRLTYWWFEG
jgi:hypothetical protein